MVHCAYVKMDLFRIFTKVLVQVNINFQFYFFFLDYKNYLIKWILNLFFLKISLKSVHQNVFHVVSNMIIVLSV
jgi:hypothetical protein